MTTKRIKLSGAQATRVREALQRFDESNETYGYEGPTTLHIVVEDLVNDILEVVGR